MTIKLPNQEDRRAYSGYKHDDSKVIIQIQESISVPKNRKIKSMINKFTHKEVYEAQHLASSATKSTARLELKYNSYNDMNSSYARPIQTKLQSKTMLTRRNVFLFVIFCSSVSLQLKHMQQPWQALLFSIIAIYATSLSVTYGTYLSWRAIKSLLVIISTKARQAIGKTESQNNNNNNNRSSPTTDSSNTRRSFRLSWLYWNMRGGGGGEVKEKARLVEMSDLETNPIVVFQYRHFWWMAVLFTVLVPTMILCIDCTAESQQLLQSSSQDDAQLSERAIIAPENDRVLDRKSDYKLPAKSKPTLANLSSERDPIKNDASSYDIDSLDDEEGPPKVRRSLKVSAATKNKRRIGRMTGSKSKLEPEDENNAQATIPNSFASEPNTSNVSNQEDDQLCNNCNTDDQPLQPTPQPSSQSGARMHRRAPFPNENNHVTNRLISHKRPVSIGAAPYVLPSFSPKPQSSRNNFARSPLVTSNKYSNVDNLNTLQPLQLLDITQQHKTRRVANSRPKFYNNYDETGAQASIPTTSTLEPTWSNLQVQKDEYQPAQVSPLCIGCTNDDQQQQQQQQQQLQQPFIPQSQSQNIALLSRKNYPSAESNQPANRFMTFGMPILAASPYVPTNFTSLAHLNSNPSKYSRVLNNRLGNNYNANNNNHNILQPLQLSNAPYLHRIGRVANSKSKIQPNYDETGAQASVLTTSTSDPTWSSSQNQEDDYQQSPQTIQITAVPNGGFVGNGFNGLNGLNGFGGLGGLAGLNALNGWGGGPWNGRQVLLVNRQPQGVGTGMEWRSWMLPVAIILALPLILGALFVPMFLKSVMLLIQILQMLGLLMPPSQLAAHLTSGSHNQQSG